MRLRSQAETEKVLDHHRAENRRIGVYSRGISPKESLRFLPGDHGAFVYPEDPSTPNRVGLYLEGRAGEGEKSLRDKNGQFCLVTDHG